MSKTDQARSLIRQIFTTETDLYPDKENNVLNVSLHSLSTQKANEIAAYLCEVLNKTEQLYPGTNMILRFKSASSPNPWGQVFWNWTQMNLHPEEVELTSPRDSEDEVEETIEFLENKQERR